MTEVVQELSALFRVSTVSKVRSVTTAELRGNLSEFIAHVVRTREPIAVRRYGKLLVAVVPIGMFEVQVAPKPRRLRKRRAR